MIDGGLVLIGALILFLGLLLLLVASSEAPFWLSLVGTFLKSLASVILEAITGR